MRFTTAVAALAAALPFSQAISGWNVAANNPDGSCLTTAQWTTAFNQLKGLNQGANVFRVYAASDCNTLQMAVPAALSTGSQLLVGIWTEDQAHYTAEKDALAAAIQAHGTQWIYAVSVGSEDLYRNDTTPSTLANQIYDVRGMIRQWGANQPVGHVDVTAVWTNTSNSAVIDACDFIGMDGYPYWQGVTMAQASNTFWTAVHATQGAAKGKPVWVTETGWPVSGPSFGKSVASPANAQKYWNKVYCKAAKEINIFWYVYQDWNQSPSFGLFGSSGQKQYDLKACP